MTRLKASELRIGNLIYDRHNAREGTIMRLNAGEMYPITYSFDKTFECSMPYGTTIEGIILTEDWLLRFGFESRERDVPALDTIIYYILDGHEFIQDINNKWFLGGYSWNTNRFSYVHQLQNLYFVLTGNELEIKP